LNLTIDETNLQTIEASFSRIANEILNEHIILIDSRKYRVITIEFYFYNNTNHKDENSHALKYSRAKERQLLYAKWYLHKISINSKYKHKGLDFTFGNKENFGGILIKEILDIETNIKFTQSKLVDEFIKVLKPSSKEEFLEMIEVNDKIKFEKMEIGKQNIETSPRKGLVNESFKNNHYAYRLTSL